LKFLITEEVCESEVECQYPVATAPGPVV
jgi:hypothetical protein